MKNPRASEYRSFPRPTTTSEVTAATAHQLPPTPGDILGPFYRAVAPFRTNLCDYPDLFITGRITDRDGVGIGDAILDVWQADSDGKYDNDGFKLRGKIELLDPYAESKKGFYSIETTKPGYYDISEPTDPEPHEFRCAHIHVMITAPGFNRHEVSGPGIDGSIKVALLTQLYFADSKYDDTDRWFDERRCVKFGTDPSRGMFDFVLERE